MIITLDLTIEELETLRYSLIYNTVCPVDSNKLVDNRVLGIIQKLDESYKKAT